MNSNIARYSLLHRAAARPISFSFIIYLFCHPLSIALNLYNWCNGVKFQWVRFLLALIQAGVSEAFPVKYGQSTASLEKSILFINRSL
jgi:hypothetical protein